MPDFAHLKIAMKPQDERPYNYLVLIAPVAQGSRDAQHRYTFYPDNGLRWFSHEPVRAEDGKTQFCFPDEAVARKFADRFGGEYLAKPLTDADTQSHD